MNESLNLPKLIAQLAADTDSDPVAVRRFLHELFSLVEQALTAGEIVEIKGVGEFVKTDDPSNPIKFLADNELAEAVNQPFAAFEAVELADSVSDADFATVDEKENATAAEPIAVSAPAEVPTPVEEPTPAEVPTPAEEPIVETTPTEEEIVEPQPEPEPTPVVEPEPAHVAEVEPEPIPEPEPEITTEPSPEVEPTIEPKAEPTIEPVAIQNNPTQSQHDNTHSKLMLILGMLIGIVIGVAAGYYAGRLTSQIDQANAELGLSETQDTEDALDIDSDFTDITTEEPEAPIATAEETAAAPTPAPAAEKAPEAKAEQKAATKSAEPVYDTVSANRYLSIIARDHYGKKSYWIFIYEANPSLGNPNNIAPGTKVLVPSRESFDAGSPAATDAKAQQLLNALSKKYKL